MSRSPFAVSFLLLTALIVGPSGASAQSTVSLRAPATLQEPLVAGQRLGAAVTVTLLRAGSSALPLSVSLSYGGTADRNSDYTAVPQTVTIPSGAASASFTVAARHDVVPEEDETMVIRIEPGPAYSTGSAASATLTLLDNDQTIRFTVVDAAAAEPGDPAIVELERLGSTTSDLWVKLAVSGSITKGVDIAPLPDSVLLIVGKRAATLTITPKPDGVAEGTETVTLSASGFLVQPSGGVSISIRDAAATLAVTTSSVVEGSGATGTFTVTRTGDVSKSEKLTFITTGTATRGVDYDLPVSLVELAAGQTTAALTVTLKADLIAEGAETIVLTLQSGATLAAGSPNSATLVVVDNVPLSVATVAIAPSVVTGGATTTGTVTLNGVAPAGGTAVALTSSSTVVQMDQGGIVVPAGSSSATFKLSTAPVATNTPITISAAAPTGAPVTSTVTVQAPTLTGLTLSRSSATPQAMEDSLSVTGTVTLNGEAPSGGMRVALRSTMAAADIAGSVTVPAGRSEGTFTIRLRPVLSNTIVSIEAAHAGVSRNASLTVNVPRVASLTISPNALAGRKDTSNLALATFSLDGPVASQGATLTIEDGGWTVSPATLFLQGGTTGGTFNVKPKQVPNADMSSAITVRFRGGQRIAPFTVLRSSPVSVVLSSATTVGGSTGPTVTVTLDGDNSIYGSLYYFESSSPAAGRCGPNGQILTTGQFWIEADSSKGTFPLCTRAVPVATVVQITARSGTRMASGTLTVLPDAAVTASSLVLATNTVTGSYLSTLQGQNGQPGRQFGATLVLTAPPTSDFLATVSSNHPAVRFRVGATGTFSQTLQIPVASGQSTVTFSAAVDPVATNTTVQITATPGSASATLTVLAPLLSGLGSDANPTGDTLRIGSGLPSLMRVTLSDAAPAGGMVVQLASSSSLVSVPSSVTVPANTNSATFSAVAGTTATDDSAYVMATIAAIKKRATVRVSGPLRVTALTVSPTTIPAGTTGTGTVTLSGAAPAGGATVPLSVTGGTSGPPAQVPGNVFVPAGAATATFSVAPLASIGTTAGTISSTFGGSATTASFAVAGYNIADISAPASIASRDTATITVSLNAVAPVGGVPITLAGLASAALSGPATDTVPAGQITHRIPVTAGIVASPTSVNISAGFQSSQRSRSVQIHPPQVAALTGSSAIAGDSVLLTLKLSTRAPASGLSVTLSSASSTLVVPSVLAVPADADQVSVRLRTPLSSASTTALVTASGSGMGSAQTQIPISASPRIASVSTALSVPNTGGTTTTRIEGTITLTGAAPANYEVTISGSSGLRDVPQVVVIPKGQTTFTFILSAPLNGLPRTETITVTSVNTVSQSVVVP